jgi:hypothetical protein
VVRVVYRVEEDDMKLTTMLFACLTVISAPIALDARDATTLTVSPAEMGEGETKTVMDDGRTITVRREGDTTRIEIEGASQTETLSITRDGNRIRIRRQGDGSRRIIIPGGTERLPLFRSFPGGKNQTFFVCPKDLSMLRVPEEKSGETYRCPVDGTAMEKRRGRGFTLFFDDSAIDL